MVLDCTGVDVVPTKGNSRIPSALDCTSVCDVLAVLDCRDCVLFVLD